ncbi:serine kinase [Plectonema cf. radiosum LEGE 06105]|uniref:Serine kinase n=1 Tax=Plectonema cf. radiosum LEGE 06105 TaxID=945769 RepID=A0A8J7F464_9CYAN|nr:serine kinase [Plectonema radiosum]MBE9213095.1 serine kinase [Plectonema cf. radiosum LEGE 06105]
MFTYFAYNLRIHSEILFPELITFDCESNRTEKLPEVILEQREINHAEIENADGGNRFVGHLEINKSQFCRFLVEFGRKIVIEPTPGIAQDIIRPGILGPIFSVLLRQRGLLTIHASCVAIDGEAVAFIGHSGWGKSTLANAFYNQGYPLLTDDVMAIQVNEQSETHPITFPAYPCVKLLPDAAASLGYDFDQLAVINSDLLKRHNTLAERFVQKPLPIKRIYALEKIAAPYHQVEPLSCQNALVELVRHSRVTNLLTTPEFVSAHLHQCTQLLKKVPVYRLKRYKGLTALPDLVKLIEDDVAKNNRVISYT